jgi:manganese/zinc/iron transport system substrate-binding protein
MICNYYRNRCVIRAFFDLTDSDRRSNVVFCRIFACADLRFFRSTGVLLSGKYSNVLLAGLIGLGLALISSSGLTQEKPKLQIVTTTAMIADIARALAGDRAEVTALMGEGVDPHLYQQTRSDLVRIDQADIVIANGLFLEAQLEPVLKALVQKSAGLKDSASSQDTAHSKDPGRIQKIVFLEDFLGKESLLAAEEQEKNADPHIWLDVSLWQRVSVGVLKALIARDPEQLETYRNRAAIWEARLSRLHDYARRSLASIPAEKRLLITAHDAFRYFARAYGLEVMGIQGISTENEAGLKRIREIIDVLVTRKIGAVFVESSVSDRHVRALIEGAAARRHAVVVAAELFSDSMGKPGAYEGSYIGMLDHNVTRITRALGGEAPLRGLNGLLASEP